MKSKQENFIKRCLSIISNDKSDSFYEGKIDWDNLEKYFVIRTYSTTTLVECKWNNKHIKSFPLIEEYVNNDYPEWDNGGIPDDLFEMICEMENSDEVNYYDDIVEEMYSQHKIGGYPNFIQSGDDSRDIISFDSK